MLRWAEQYRPGGFPGKVEVSEMMDERSKRLERRRRLRQLRDNERRAVARLAAEYPVRWTA